MNTVRKPQLNVDLPPPTGKVAVTDAQSAEPHRPTSETASTCRATPESKAATRMRQFRYISTRC